jgi:hypothetical protein
MDRKLIVGSALGVLALIGVASGLSVIMSGARSLTAAVSDFNSDLIAHYSFDAGTGADISGGGNNGTIVGATASAGKVGGGLTFDGADDHVVLGEIAGSDNVDELTVSAWVKSSQTTGQMNIISKQTSSTESWSLMWSSSSSGFYGFNVYNTVTAGGTARTGLGVVPDNNWHHVVGIYDGSNIKLYFDGVLQSTQPALTGMIKDTTLGVCVGTWSAGGGACIPSSGNWDGSMDDVRLYSRALTCAEVGELYALGGNAAPSCGGTVTPPQGTPPPGSNDSTPPSTSIASPSANSTHSGVINVAASASDNVGVAGVTFKVDGATIGSEDTGAPYSISLNTATLSNGSHTLTAVARDTSGLTTTSSGVTITVSNSAITPVPHKTVSWAPPIGIPEPPFGIREDVSHFILRSGETCSSHPQKCYNYGSGAEAYRLNPQGEPYTHYVDGSNYPNNCVVNNDGSVQPYGTVELPLCRMPLNLPPGSIVEIHGTFALHHQSPANITIQGTVQRPVFIRSTANDKARIHSVWDIAGSYGIIENLIFQDQDGDRSGGAVGFLGVAAPSDHISIRHSEFDGNLQTGGVGFANSQPNPVAINNRYGVIWNNYVHDGGNPWAATDSPGDGADRGGIYLAGKYMWALDNKCLRNGSTCVRTGGFAANDLSLTPAFVQYIFIGRNEASLMREANFWTKQATHVVFSQNKAGASVQMQAPSGKGGGMGFQYGPEDVWFLFNHISGAANGIGIGSNLDEYGKNMYIIGNVIHDIHKHPTLDTVGAQAISIGGSINRYILNNTIYDVDTGIRILNGRINAISGNIISTVPATSGGALTTDLVHMYLQDETGLAEYRVTDNLLHQPGGSAKIRNAYAALSLSELNSTIGSGNTEGDPKFVSAGSGNLNIQSTSAAKDIANSTLLEQLAAQYYVTYGTNIASDLASPYFKLSDVDIRKDFLGNNRAIGALWDSGAYEYGASGGTQLPPTLPNTYTLTVTKRGTGQGTVTASGMISCGALCTAQNSAGTSVTLTAVPAAGSSFSGWSDSCTSTALTCTFILNGHSNVVATFSSGASPSPSVPPVTADTTGPSITSVQALNLTKNSATITWNTNENARSQVQYGVTSSFGTLTASTTFSAVHTISLTALLPDTLYHYRVISSDAVGNTTVSAAGTFATQSETGSQGNNRSSSGNTGYTRFNVPPPDVAGGSAGTQPCVVAGGLQVAVPFARTLQLGSTGADVKSLQKFLNARGFKVAITGAGSPGLETLTFGPATKAAVIRFQVANNIQPTSGLFGPITRAKANSLLGSTTIQPTTCPPVTQPIITSVAFTRTLQLGSTGSDVKALQQFLNSKGFKVSATGAGSPGFETSTFGPATKAAVMRFQTANNIVPTSGIFGPLTRVKVNSMR